jgi:hypothetical protein
MNLSGWIVLALSVGGTTSFFAWCIWRVLSPPGKTKRLHGILDTELKIEAEEKSRRKSGR